MKHLRGDWLELAKALEQGSRIRTQCSDGCGSDNSQLISHSPKGFSRHCFRCRANQFVPHGVRSIQDIHRHRLEREHARELQVELPSDYSIRIPEKHMLWFFKYGISHEDAAKHHLGWSEKHNRIVLPVYNRRHELQAIQMRAVGAWQDPKYLNPTGPNVARALLEVQKTGTEDRVVIVEDILSAIKVGKVHNSVSILGTNLTESRSFSIRERYTSAIVWMDGDKAGKRGQRAAIHKLLMLGMQVKQIRTPCDPKTYSLEDIRLFIEGATPC